MSSPSSGSGANPLLPSPGTSTAAPGSTNPLTAGFSSGSVPTFGANGPGAVSLTTPGPGPKTNVGQAAASPIGGISTMSPTDLSRMFDSLKKSYGDGPAHAILNFLTSGAGFNQDAINNIFAAMQPQIERGTQSLINQFSTSGNRFGSGAQLGLADFLSQVNLNEGQIESNMYENAIQNYLGVLMPTSSEAAKVKANSPSFLDNLASGLQLGTSGAQGASSAISAISPTADTSILDAIGALAL
jgi:hypothetical protein